MAIKPSARNPFRFGKARVASAPAVAAVTAAPAPVAIPEMTLRLSGVANAGGKRTAIISGDGQVYLAKEGEAVAGRYHVVVVDSDAVTLRDDTGGEIWLNLK